MKSDDEAFYVESSVPPGMTIGEYRRRRRRLRRWQRLKLLSGGSRRRRRA
jgi:hypothetical protein